MNVGNVAAGRRRECEPAALGRRFWSAARLLR
jgi:hypothetical protein